MAQTTAEVAGSTTTTGLRRHLGLPDVIAQSVTVIAPGMSGAFITYLAATKAGGATPLAFLLAALGALCIGGVVSEFGRSLPSAGSLYTYTTVGLSRTAGFALGWMYSIAFVILAGAVLAGFGFFTSLLIASLTDQGTIVPWYWFFLAGLAFVGVMSMFDVRISTRTQLAFTALSVILMVIAAIAVIGTGTPALSVIDGETPLAQAGKSLDLGAFWPSAAGIPWSGIVFGFAFGILSFTGFEAGAVLAEETTDPKRNIPRAVVGSVLVGGLFYLVVTYATSIGFGVRQAAVDWPTSAAGLVAVAPSKLIGDLVLFAVVVSSLFCGLGVHTAASRFLYAMGRERVLPPALGRIHSRWRTPWPAILMNLALMAVLCFGLLAVTSRATQIALGGGATDAGPNFPADQRGGLFVFGYLATLATPAVMVAYFLLGLAGIRKGLADSNVRFVAVSVLATVTGSLAIFGSVYYSFKEAAPGAGVLRIIAAVPWLNLAVLAVGVAVAVYLRNAKPRTWTDMGAVFEEA